MYLGIVGHEAAKFTPETKALARQAIRDLISKHDPNGVVSGKCPLGGIDIWAIEEARHLGIQTREFPPEVNTWDGSPWGKIGFKQRNQQIADNSSIVVCVVVRELPTTYKGMTFGVCYHCARHPHTEQPPPHVKSGGCWTAWQCAHREWVII